MRTLPLLLALSLSAAAAEPLPPSKEIPRVDPDDVYAGCVDCAGQFSLSEHEKALEELVKEGAITNELLAEMRRAMYWQDIVHQIESKAHFDNCAFDDASAYVGELTNEVAAHVKEAEARTKAGDAKKAHAATKEAFYTLGQALHAIQDFYAHSNYLELQRDSGVALNAIAVVPVWTAAGRTALTRMQREQHLHSGEVSWGFRKYCNGGESHHDLNKDTDSSARGGVHVKQWQNKSLHRAAREVAVRASLAYLKFAYRQWPYLARAAGQRVVFDVFQDRRGL
ncbi:MAG TPA: HET-C-related protein [Thermoanaerobaculia bacterium]|nr:HET-C-related protein [Thermoanaerobaculia bacterium]